MVFHLALLLTKKLLLQQTKDSNELPLMVISGLPYCLVYCSFTGSVETR